MLRALIKSSTILSIGLVLGRILGYVREVFVAKNYGASDFSDLVILLLVVPDLANNLISSGVYNSIFLPRIIEANYSSDRRKIILQAYQHAFLLSSILFFLISIVVLFFYDFSKSIVISIALISVIINSVTTISVVKLTFHEKFKVQSLGNFIFNFVFILFLVIDSNIYFLALGVNFAALVRAIVLTYYSDKTIKFLNFVGIILRFNIKEFFREIKILIIAILSYGLVFINPVVDKLFCSKIASGGISIFNYAEKLYMLPVTILITPLAVVSFPKIVRLIESRDVVRLRRDLVKILIVIAITSLVICGFINVFSFDIVRMIFGGGALSEREIQQTASILKKFLVAVFFSGFIALGMNMLFALKREKLALMTSLVGVLFNLFGDTIVIVFDLNIDNIATVTSCVSVVSFVMITFCCTRAIKVKY